MMKFRFISRDMLFGVLTFATVFGFSNAYNYGAPEGACTAMFPTGHGVAAQSGASTYTVTANTATYSAGDTISVTLAGGTFKGFFLQARLVGQTTSVGTWTVSGSTALRCISKAITHTNSADKTSVTLQWTAPSPSPAGGNIEFVATVVQVKSIFWVGLKSSVVSDPTAPTVTSSATTASTPSSPITIDTSACGTTKGCFRSQSDCTQSTCDYLVTWENSGSTVMFEMSGTNENAEGYIALGLSTNKQMGGTSVTHCAMNGGVVQVAQSYNDGYNNVPANNDQLGLSNTAGYYSGGRISCSFTRESVITPTNSEVSDLGVNYYMFFASGPAFSGSISKHDQTPVISDTQIDATSSSYTDLSGSVVVSDLERVHGILMITAWMFCAGMGILLARFYKNAWPSSKLCDTAIWFALHRALMITNLVCTITAFVVIFIDAKRWSTWGVSVNDAHPYIGVVVALLVIINPIMATCRPHPGEPNRVVFNWAHWAVGKSGHILAYVNIFIGMSLPQSKVFTPRAALWLTVAFAVFHGLVEIILEIDRCRHNKKSTNKEMEMSPIGQSNSTVDNKDAESSALRPIFGVYAFVSVGVWVSVVVLMALGPL